MAKANQAAKLFHEAVQRITTRTGYDKWLERSVKFVSGGDDGLLVEMTVGEEHVNAMGHLHGGCTATLVDLVTATVHNMAPTRPTGVTVELSVSYLKAAKLGDVLQMEAKPLRLGRNLAFLSLSIKNKADGSMIATGKHISFMDKTPMPPAAE